MYSIEVPSTYLNPNLFLEGTQFPKDRLLVSYVL